MRTIQELIDRRKHLWKIHHDIQKDANYKIAVANYIVDNNYRELHKEMADNPELMVELFFVVVDKKRKTVPFILNDVQLAFIKRINKQKRLYKEGKTNKKMFLILKGRQQG